MIKITISKGVIQNHINDLLHQVQSLMKGKTLDNRELNDMQELLWRVEHYIHQGEDNV